MIDVNCGTCFFGQPVKGPDGVFDFKVRECHRFPANSSIVAIPTGPNSMELKNLSSYPTRPKEDWCGEHSMPPPLANSAA